MAALRAQVIAFGHRSACLQPLCWFAALVCTHEAALMNPVVQGFYPPSWDARRSGQNIKVLNYVLRAAATSLPAPVLKAFRILLATTDELDQA